MIRDAREIFHEPDFTRSELDRIFVALNGHVVRLPGARRRGIHDLTPSLLAYARAQDWRSGLPVSRRHFFRVLKRLRGDESQENAVRCQGWGLSLRDLGRLLGVSTPTVQMRLRGAANKTAGDGV